MTYNTEAFTLAHQRFLSDAKSLTDDDFAQFALVDPKLAERARAKRAGFVEAEDDDEQTRKALAKPLTAKFLVHWMKDTLGPVLATHRYKAQQIDGRIEALEQRLAEREFTVATLEQRIKTLELELQAERAVAR